MKNSWNFNKILLFFCVFALIFAIFSINTGVCDCSKIKNNSTASAFVLDSKQITEDDLSYQIFLEGRNFKFNRQNLISKLNLSNYQKNIIKNIKKNIEILQNMGLDHSEIVRYLCPESKIILEKIKSVANKPEEKSRVKVVKNKCKLEFFDGKKGRFVNEQKFYEDIFEQLKSNKNNIKITAKIDEYSEEEDLSRILKEKSCFSTGFTTSSPSRKNNIARALAVFDGLVLEEGEILSFNQATGVRDESSGYQKAKIISGGTFTEGYGGGVCQVSTTLYNACLLAGLEILEVHSHSLPVSYIEPSFDAMVNVGSSDLVIRNNSGGKLIFTSSSENDICKIKIYGLKNKYKITRFSEKTKIIPAEPDIIETDYSKYGDFDLQEGEEKRLSYAKDGFYSNGYLNFYDTSGNLVETKKIRENKYNATKGVILKNEG